MRAIGGRAAWRGDELERAGDWIRSFDDGHRAELHAALDRVRSAPLFGFIRAEFPLDRTAALLADIADELENGTGALRLRGLPVERYDTDDLRRIFWGIGLHLGTPLYQNPRGEIMGEVRDESHDTAPTYIDAGPGRVQSSRARARSSGPLRFHTDRCDVIALLCASNARAGGDSKLASIATIHDEMLRRRPDLLELLFADYWRRRPEDEDGAHAEPAFALPVFGLRENRITSQYSRTYVEQAQELPGVPALTSAQNEALDLLAEIAEETCLVSPFVPGDIQLLNNHLVYHGRTAYEDDAGAHQQRLLLRLWLAMPNSRALPEGFDVFWGSVEPGTLRGGVPQRDGRRTSLTL